MWLGIRVPEVEGRSVSTLPVGELSVQLRFTYWQLRVVRYRHKFDNAPPSCAVSELQMLKISLSLSPRYKSVLWRITVYKLSELEICGNHALLKLCSGTGYVLNSRCSLSVLWQWISACIPIVSCNVSVRDWSGRYPSPTSKQKHLSVAIAHLFSENDVT